MAFDTSELLDPVGCRILAELQADGRVTLAELGRRVSLSPPAVAERVRRLEEAGVITGYTARVDPQAVGYSLLAFVRLSPQGPGDLYARRVRRFLEERQEVLEAHHITGEDCYLIKIVARDGGHLEEVIAELGSMGRTTTSVALSAPVPPAPVVPASDDTAPRRREPAEASSR